MMKRKLLVIIFLLIILLFAYVIYAAISVKKPATSSDRKHKITFNVGSCFAAYGGSCDYVVDDNDTYTLDEFVKTKCIYDLDNGTTGKFHDLISELVSEGDSIIDIYLEGEEFKQFISCAKDHSR